MRTNVAMAMLAGWALLGMSGTAPTVGDNGVRAGSEPAVIPVHEDYDWIRKGGYKGVDGTSCCGRDDCDQIPAARVERTPHGYRLQDFGLFVPFRQSQTSEDGNYWLCRDAKVMRCFFAPPPGS